ncbi:Hpt domain-containing protein [Flavobacterium flavipallidum]|uniref:Hpt domain-containing protein n=1 Tax=Flavobacterium flavipallidum TaxID=3139140 RepID=A0ABU9HIR4_9FLAO
MEQPNFSYINSFSGGDKEFEKKIFEVIKAEFPIEKAKYFDNIASNNFELASNDVHKMRHKISLLGLEEGFNLATQHESNLQADNKNLHEKYSEILSVMGRFLDAL